MVLQTRLGVYELDREGHLIDAKAWTLDFRDELAGKLGLKLLPEHHAVVRFLRDYYEAHGHLPRIRELCVGLPATIRELYELFPTGLSLACQLAGLPRPSCG